jgi:hypothetical protein
MSVPGGSSFRISATSGVRIDGRSGRTAPTMTGLLIAAS